MHQDQIGWLVAGVLAVVCLVLLVLLARGRRRAVPRSALEEDALDDLRTRLDQLERGRDRPSGETPPPSEPGAKAGPDYVITGIPADRTLADAAPPTGPPAGSPTGSPTGPVAIDGATFADTVLRETVVKAASLAHGVRRGLAPATRNRIRFEMKQEVRRARRQRKADAKQALREKHARDRALLAEEAEAS